MNMQIVEPQPSLLMTFKLGLELKLKELDNYKNCLMQEVRSFLDGLVSGSIDLAADLLKCGSNVALDRFQKLEAKINDSVKIIQEFIILLHTCKTDNMDFENEVHNETKMESLQKHGHEEDNEADCQAARLHEISNNSNFDLSPTDSKRSTTNKRFCGVTVTENLQAVNAEEHDHANRDVYHSLFPEVLEPSLNTSTVISCPAGMERSYYRMEHDKKKGNGKRVIAEVDIRRQVVTSVKLEQNSDHQKPVTEKQKYMDSVKSYKLDMIQNFERTDGELPKKTLLLEENIALNENSCVPPSEHCLLDESDKPFLFQSQLLSDVDVPSKHSSENRMVEKSQSSWLQVDSELNSGLKSSALNITTGIAANFDSAPTQVRDCAKNDEVIIDNKAEENNSMDKALCSESAFEEKNDCSRNEDDMNFWNPMTEEFSSIRNNYQIDRDNACVAIEGYDPDKLKICEYYLKGRCWYGNSCSRLHPKMENGQVIPQIPTFVESDIPDQEMETGLFYVGCIMKVCPLNNSFYIQLLDGEGYSNFDTCFGKLNTLPCISQEMDLIMHDMDVFYSVNKRSCDLTNICEGEIYCVYIEKCQAFLRGMVIGIEENEIKMFLLDIGNEEIVSYKNIFQMNIAFMHVRKQTALCCLEPEQGEITKDFEGLRCVFQVTTKFEFIDNVVNVILHL